MNTKINMYIDDLFSHTPRTTYVEELKEEMKVNLNEKYEDLIREGKSLEEAYVIATSSIGDIRELISGLDESAVIITTKDLEKRKQKSGLITSIAVMLYILCGASVIGFAVLGDILWGIGEDGGGAIGVIVAIVMVAIATGMLIFDNVTKPEVLKEETQERLRKQSMTEDERKREKIQESLSGLLWVATVAIYLVISFITGAWSFSWIIFIIAVAAQSVLKLIFQLKE